MPIKPVSGKIKSQDINDNFSYIDSAVKTIDKGAPRGSFNTLADLRNAYPNGSSYIYLVLSNGHWYFWDGEDWASGGVYQSTQIPNKAVTDDKLSDELQNSLMFNVENISRSINNNSQYWTSSNAILSDLGDQLVITGNGANTFARAYAPASNTPKNGDKVFIYVKCKVTNDNADSVRILLREGTSGEILLNESIVPVINQSVELYFYLDITKSLSSLYLMIDHIYPDATTADGKIMYVELSHISIVSDYFDEVPNIDFYKSQITPSNNLFNAKKTVETMGNLYKKIDEGSINIDTSSNTNSSIVKFITSPTGVNHYETVDNYKFPLSKIWGNEYMYGWYKKLIENSALKMVWAGDSTTANTSISDPQYHRNSLGKKILTKGGYEETAITSLNHGHGGNHTGDWLEQWLDEDMSENPDLYILAYGINDGGTNYFSGTTIQERVDGFESRLREGLGRIRTSESFPSGLSYNLSPDELPIILCTPVTTNDPSRKRTNVDWYNYIRPIIQKACRDFKCAFIDLGVHQYDREYSSSWSTNGDDVHPDYISTMDYMSNFKELILPYLFEK